MPIPTRRLLACPPWVVLMPLSPGHLQSAANACSVTGLRHHKVQPDESSRASGVASTENVSCFPSPGSKCLDLHAMQMPWVASSVANALDRFNSRPHHAQSLFITIPSSGHILKARPVPGTGFARNRCNVFNGSGLCRQAPAKSILAHHEAHRPVVCSERYPRAKTHCLGFRLLEQLLGCRGSEAFRHLSSR